jgi:indole-3-glycerol phosphate synthase
VATILNRIIEKKKTELADLRKLELACDVQRVKHSFIDRMAQANEMKIIAEFKRASPSKGDINPNLIPQEQAQLYARFGADAVSVLTDTSFFKGSFSDLAAVRSVIDLPILCKDFIIDPVQIDVAKNAGADLILLIAAALEQQQLVELYQYAVEADMEVLVEIHDEEDLNKALAAKPRLIGINNRNLKTFEVDLGITERLAPLVKETGAQLISESGIKTARDVERVKEAGAQGILVGETFMTASDLGASFKQLKLPLGTVL